MSTRIIGSGLHRARWIVVTVVAAVLALLAATAGNAQAATSSDIAVENAFISTPGKAFSLQGVVVTNNGPDAAAGVTVTGQVPAKDDEGHAVDWEIFTNKATDNGGAPGFVAYMNLTGPPYGVDPCTFTSGTDYKCDIGPLAVGESRTIVFNPTWEDPTTTADLAHQWHGFSISADVVGGTDPHSTNNDNVANFDKGFYYTKSMAVGAQPDKLQIAEQSPPASGVHDPGATVTLKITSTVNSSTTASISLVVPNPDDVTCTGDGVCLTGGPHAMTGPANRVMISMVGPPIVLPGGWYFPATPPPHVFTTLLTTKLPAAPAGCKPGGTVPFTFDGTQQPLWGGSGPVWGAIVKMPLTVQIRCPTPKQPSQPSTPTKPTVKPPAPTPKADLSIAKTASKSPRVGHRMRYGIKVTNHGPGTAHDVVVTDKLPGKLRLISAKTNHGSCTGHHKLRCKLGDLADGKHAKIRLTVKALRGGKVKNTARVQSGTPDTNSKNNVASVRRRIARHAHLSLRKTVNHKVVTAGKLVRFRITVRNSGPATARNVRVCDKPPYGLAFVKTPHAKLRKGAACWTFKRLARGKARTMRVIARANGTSRPRTITNRVSARASNATARRARARVRVRPVPVPPSRVTG